ncbi:SagB family peptide dehydrogenase [Pseudomonas sp. NPDC087697]|uniref:SagB family peptide dehydrogenase n=1 Tax=Pseudomonas sp. NPDC087697 TaxID=3364447 RepID=UPI003803D390
MQLNPCIFLLPKPPRLFIWNYKSHEQFEIDNAHASRLIELIEKISIFDENHPIDAALLEAGILVDQPLPPNDWQWDDLSKIFHVGTKDLGSGDAAQNTRQWAEHYFNHCQEVISRHAPPPHPLAHLHRENMLCLPAPLADEAIDERNGFRQALLQRKTCRSYLDKAVSLNDVSTLLYLCLGYLKERETDTSELIPVMFRARRSSPSGGGLNASEGYLYAYNVQGLDPGIYYYHPDAYALTLLSRLKEPLGSLLQGQHFVDNIPFGIFITSRLDKMWWKYRHSQAYRVSLLEIGHISQTLQLCATSLGLKTWLTAALSESKIEKYLNLNDLSEQVFLFVGAGYSNGEAFCEELRSLLNKNNKN